MAILVKCKCGKQLGADPRNVGKMIQCPACGRALQIPRPVEEKTRSVWQIDASPSVAEKAEGAGVVARDRANVVRLHSAGELREDLQVEGALTCWHCRTDIACSGTVFGRPGLGGTLVALACTVCNARYWVGFSSHVIGEGTEIFLYAPSYTRDYARTDRDTLSAPAYQVHRVGVGRSANAAPVKENAANNLLTTLIEAVERKEPYQDLSARAAQLVGLPLSAAQIEGVCLPLRNLLSKETNIYQKAVLIEALACLRDERAVTVVRPAIRAGLEGEDLSDPNNLPLHDLCLLGLVFGDGNAFLEAFDGGLQALKTPTRASTLGKRLTWKEVAQLTRAGNPIAAYESSLGGNHWQQIHPLLPLWVAEDDRKGKGWMNRLFKSKQ